LISLACRCDQIALVHVRPLRDPSFSDDHRR
jgi:hypothetical protein